MRKKMTERKRQKYLAHLTTIAEAFLKARAVYPSDYKGFLQVAGQKEVDTFYQTMHLIEKGATEYGYRFNWCLVNDSWNFWFDDLLK